jgi:hypothetical protein
MITYRILFIPDLPDLVLNGCAVLQRENATEPAADRDRRDAEKTVEEVVPGAIPTPRSIIWAQEIFSIGVYNREYFLDPKNRSLGSESRGEK